MVLFSKIFKLLHCRGDCRMPVLEQEEQTIRAVEGENEEVDVEMDAE